MIKIKRVKVERAEGPCELCITREFETLRAANDWLAENSLTAPERCGYDKHDFWIEWEDGHTYKGRLDVEHVGRGGAERIGSHVREWLRFNYGMLADSEVPNHLTPEDYRRYVSKSSAEDCESARNFLATYDLSDF
jgi:hypothetical protein